MTDRNVTLGQVRAAGRLDGVRFEFQSYGGWLTNSAFAVQSEIADGSGSSDISYLTAYSFGAASGTNPTLEPGQAFWNGVVVGKSVETGHLFQGDASVVITALSRGVQNSIANITFNALTNFNTGESLNPLTWSNLALDRGSFTSNSGDIQGTFYGTDHEEVGGIFNRDNILGSFGATRQTQ